MAGLMDWIKRHEIYPVALGDNITQIEIDAKRL